MKFRKNTKHGMCTIENCNDPQFRKVTFDKKTRLSKIGTMCCYIWMINIDNLKDLNKD